MTSVVIIKNYWRTSLVYNTGEIQDFYFDTEVEANKFADDMLRWKNQLQLNYAVIQNYDDFIKSVFSAKAYVDTANIYSLYNAGPWYLNRGKEFFKAYQEYSNKQAERREWEKHLCAIH